MALDGVVSSPHRRTQSAQSSFLPSTNKKQLPKGDELNSWSALYQRHRFLLVAFTLLVFLCTIYLYFAIILGAAVGDPCSGLTGSQKALCHVREAKNMDDGKLKFH